jgi:hypothetical protein
MQAEKLEHDTGSRDSKGDAHKLALNFEMRVGIYHQKDDEDEPSATQEKPGSALRQLNDSRRYAVFCLDHSWAPRSFTARNSLPAIGDSKKNCRRSPFHLTNMAVAAVDEQAELMNLRSSSSPEDSSVASAAVQHRSASSNGVGSSIADNAILIATIGQFQDRMLSAISQIRLIRAMP